jgi:FkbM family methyltransferase
MLRTLAERVSRGMTLRRRLPASVGGLPLYVSPDAQLKYLKPSEAAFDGNLLRVAAEQIKADSVVWDIGANVGVFTFAAAGIATRGQVLAVEPDSWLAQVLRQSVALRENRGRTLAVLAAAVADRNGVSEFAIAKRGRASSYLVSAGGWTQAGGERARVHVPTLTLDTLLETFAPPTFLKIDVEGAEVMVLSGARRLLEKIRPVIFIEVGRANARKVTEILTEFRYSLYDGTKAIAGQQAGELCAEETLAVPALGVPLRRG